MKQELDDGNEPTDYLHRGSHQGFGLGTSLGLEDKLHFLFSEREVFFFFEGGAFSFEELVEELVFPGVPFRLCLGVFFFAEMV